MACTTFKSLNQWSKVEEIEKNNENLLQKRQKSKNIFDKTRGV
jgi:hypothetical protein